MTINLKHVATLSCEMLCSKIAALQSSAKRIPIHKNIHPMMLGSFCSLTKNENIFTVVIPKNPQNAY